METLIPKDGWKHNQKLTFVKCVIEKSVQQIATLFVLLKAESSFTKRIANQSSSLA